MSVPEVLDQRLAGPSSAAIASMARRSAATAAVEVAGPHHVVLEGEVDDAVGRGGGPAQPVEIVQ